MVKEALSEKSDTSSTRVIIIGTAVTVLGTYLAHNIISMVKGGGMVDFALNSVLILAIAMGAKVGQKFAEVKGKNGQKPAVPGS